MEISLLSLILALGKTTDAPPGAVMKHIEAKVIFFLPFTIVNGRKKMTAVNKIEYKGSRKKALHAVHLSS